MTSPSLRYSRLAGGLLDSGLSSLATFIVGVVAARELSPASLGGYALAFQATFLAGILAQSLIFVPAQAAVVMLPPSERLGTLVQALRIGSLPAGVGALLAAGWSLFAPSSIATDVVLPLTVTGAVTAFLSPIQDHVRRMLHSGESSFIASWMSGIQLSSVALGIIIGVSSDVPAAWVPLGSLALANLVSLVFGLAWTLAHHTQHIVFNRRELLSEGRPLLGGQIANPLATFAGAAIIAFLIGPEPLGLAEAARIAAQPMLVLGLGVNAVQEPLSMSAGRISDRDQARYVSRRYSTIMLAAATVLLLGVGSDWRWNLMADLLPNAFTVPGLVAISILAQVAVVLEFPYRGELLGGKRSNTYARISAIAALIQVLTALSAVVLGAFAKPAGLLADGSVKLVGTRRAAERLYE